MTSNNSICKMIREHLRHNAWMLGLSAIGSLLFGPVFFLFAIGGNNYEKYQLLYTTQDFNDYVSSSVISDLNNCTMALVIIAAAGAAIVGFGLFSYLFQPRKIDLYHSLPVTRREMFWATYLCGLFTWAIPFLAGALFSFGSALIVLRDFHMFGAILSAMFRYLLYPTVSFFIVYHLCLVGVMLSGNLANAVVSTSVWGLSVMIIYGLLITYAGAFYDHYYNPGSDFFIPYALSPLSTPFAILNFDGGFEWGYIAMWIISILIAMLNLFVAFRLYKTRKSELAGHGMVNKFAALSIRVGIAVIFGLLGVIPSYLFGYSMESRPMWMILFDGLFAAIAYAIVTAIQKRSVRAFFAHKLQLIAVTACSMMVAAIYVFDIFGYDSYLPAKDNIASMEIDINAFPEYTYYNSIFQGFEVKDSTIIYNVLSTAIGTDSKDSNFSIVVKVTPKIGLSYYRRYYMSNADLDVLRPIVETENYMAYRLKELINNMDDINSIHVYSTARSTSDIDNADSISKIIEAYLKDSSKLLSIEEQGEYLSMAELSFRICTKAVNGYTNIREVLEVPVTAAHENTIHALLEANESILCTVEQMEIRSVTISVYASELSLEDTLYMDLLPEDMLRYSDRYTKEYGIETSEAVKESAVIIDSNGDYPYHNYSHTFTEEELEWLLPYLCFSQNYNDGIDLRNYTHMGSATIQYNQEVDVYIKRGDMSPEEIQKLASYMESSDYYN